MELAGALTRAHEARDAGDRVAQLHALLDAWRLAPDPLLEHAIDEVSLQLERASTNHFDPQRRGLQRSAWREIAARMLPEDLPWLLATACVAKWAMSVDD